MNTNWKLLIGGLIGAGVGYFVGGVVIEVIYLREQTDTPEERDQMDDGYGGPNEDEFETFVRPGKKEMSDQTDYTKKFKASDSRPDIDALIEKYSPEIAELPAEEDFTIEEEEDDTDPKVITLEEYASAEGYSANTLHYYENDVVTDEEDNPVNKPEQFLGTDWVTSWGESDPNNEDVVYVRNDEKHSVYEIVRTNEPYVLTFPKREDRYAEHRRRKAEQNGEESDS